MVITFVLAATAFLAISALTQSALNRYALPAGSDGKEHPYVFPLTLIHITSQPVGLAFLYLSFIIAVINLFTTT